MKKILLVAALGLLSVGCINESQTSKDSKQVERQQEQYSANQPIPTYNFSLERDLVKQLYDARNTKAITHSVIRSNTGVIEDDCASIGFGIPYDTSLTNPLKLERKIRSTVSYSGVVEQAEPNGIFLSKNTSATWIMCVSKFGTIEPIYTESKVTAYPYSVTIDYKNNRVIRDKGSKSSVTINMK